MRPNIAKFPNISYYARVEKTRDQNNVVSMGSN